MIWHTEKVLIIVKAYPTPSTKHGETVCTAGITHSGKWIRLYPIPYRDLPKDKQYGKFQWIQVDVTSSNEKLGRPESHKVNIETLQPLEMVSVTAGWHERMKYFLPTVSKSLDELEIEKDKHKVSLGAFKPKTVDDFTIEKDDEDWNESKLKVLQQKSLFNPDKTTLRKVPYKFRYKFHCNDITCKGHDMQIIDWEIAQAYWNFKRIYKTEELTLKMIREKWFIYHFKQRESYFVAGTDSHWNKFMILTVVSPKRKTDQLDLFT